MQAGDSVSTAAVGSIPVVASCVGVDIKGCQRYDQLESMAIMRKIRSSAPVGFLKGILAATDFTQIYDNVPVIVHIWWPNIALDK